MKRTKDKIEKGYKRKTSPYNENLVYKGKYNKNTFPDLVKTFAQQGLTDAEIARKLGISLSTFYIYRRKYPKFAKSLTAGKEPVDIEVEQALFKRAMGREIPIEEVTEVTSATGNVTKTVKKYKKYYLGDTIAQIFWLKNRQPERWRDKIDHGVSGDIIINVDKNDKKY